MTALLAVLAVLLVAGVQLLVIYRLVAGLRRAAEKNGALIARNTEIMHTVAHLLRDVDNEWRWQHAQGTYVGTIHGLWNVLKEAASDGVGLPVEMRNVVYETGDQMFDKFYAATSEKSHDPFVERGLTMFTERSEHGTGRADS